jgi:hypothetical protein
MRAPHPLTLLIHAQAAVFTNLILWIVIGLAILVGVAGVVAILTSLIVHFVRKGRLAGRGDIRPRRGYWFGVGAGSLAVVASLALVVGYIVPSSSPSTSDIADSNAVATAQAVSAKGSPYAYLTPMQNVKPTYRFDYTYSVNLDDTAKWGANGSKAIAVFFDAALTQPADYVLSSTSVAGKNQVTISPASPTWYNESGAGDREFEPYPHDQMKGGVWGPSNQLYLVRYVGQNGKKLARPVVQPFTIDRAGFLAAPTVDYSIDGNGSLQLSWTAVPKANQYAVLALTNDGDPGAAGGIVHNRYSILGLLNNGETTWSSAGTGNDDAHGQNTILEHIGSADHHVSYSVAALNDDDWASALNLIDGDPINADLPLEVASGSGGKSYDRVDSIPSRIAVKTISGDAVYFPATVDTNASMAKAGFLRLRISGTNLVSSAGLTDTSDWSNKVQEVATHLATISTGTGGIRALYHGAKPDDTSGITVSKAKPDTSYPVNGFGDGFSEYLAANMVAGKQAIDVSKYIDATPYDIFDLVHAVADQNPYILGFWGAQYDAKAKVLWVKYRYSGEEIAAGQKQLASTVDQIVASVTNAGQSDTEKAKALNDYLVANATYNTAVYDAYLSDPTVPDTGTSRNAFTALGVLQDKTGVCASFAAAYKLLADKAGLRTVVVTGTAGGPHAWNKVYLNDSWKVVDPTWNQGLQSDDLFGISDATALSDFQHREDKDWMLDSMIPTFAAN